MKRLLIIGLLCSAALVGCNSSNEQEDSTNENKQGAGENMGLAAEDEFTKQFLVSTEEEEEGFYLMRGELGGFEMLIPRDAILSDSMHQITDNVVENNSYSLDFEDENRTVLVNLLYQEGFSKEIKNDYLETYKQRIGFDKEYVFSENDDIEFYTGYVKNEYNESKPNHIYLGYLFSKSSNQALIVEYIVTCLSQENCSVETNEEKYNSGKVMESVKFK